MMHDMPRYPPQKFTFEQDCPCEVRAQAQLRPPQALTRPTLAQIDFCACAAKEGQLDDVRSFVARCL